MNNTCTAGGQNGIMCDTTRSRTGVTENMPQLTYALITPAKNEAQCIEKTILSVMSQRLAPRKWVIVDDASSDATAEIVARYAQRFPCITLVRMPIRAIRNFGSKVDAFNAGLQILKDEPYDLIGNLDADIILRTDYYSNIVSEFERDPALGVSGGVIYIPIGQKYLTRDTTWDSVGGAVQLFRRACFQQIGGYVRIETGGIDAAAEIMARMHGWTVRKVANNPVFEQRRTGFAHGRPWKAAYKEGVHYHRLGYNTLFYCLRCVHRIGDPPVLLAGLLGLIGFFYAKVRRDPICLPPEVVSYLRMEQLDKIRRHLLSKDRMSGAY
jgi:poly-beta-1,6-N-acetyl-D-glucosamine synthase